MSGGVGRGCFCEGNPPHPDPRYAQIDPPPQGEGGGTHMRSVLPALQAQLDSGATTLARCWIVTRRDGVVLGFTDHDCDLTIGSVVCRAATGFTASEATSRFDLAVDGAEISGAFSDDTLSEADLSAGRYDAAEVAT